MMQKLLMFIGLCLCWPLFAASLSQPAAKVKHSQQMLLVMAQNWNSSTGALQRYERNAKDHQWKKVGASIPIVLGKKGLAWGADLNIQSDKEPAKMEGDGRTPVGVYKIGPAFGFSQTSPFKVDYFPLDDNSVCVDDVKSVYYNQLLDSAKVPKVDWNSAEHMNQVPQYEIGSVVQYNQDTPVVGKGSCIFLHSWKSPTTGTAGCIAMATDNLQAVLKWLNRSKDPIIVVVPQDAYQTLKAQWKLPENA